MARRRHTPEQIVRKLREAEVELAKGATFKDACRKLAITEHTYYRWRREYGGLKLEQAKRLKQLEKELFDRRFKSAAEASADPSRIRHVRRAIAPLTRTLLIWLFPVWIILASTSLLIRHRQLGADPEPAVAPAP